MSSGVLDPHGPIAAAERLILLNATSIMLVVVVPVILLTLSFAWWFRASNTRAVYRPEWSYSGRIELVVWSIPAMVVILLGGVAWVGSHALDPRAALPSPVSPLRIRVVSLDWKWLFIYPDQRVASVNELFIPTGRPIEFDLTSATVMNAFFVPQLGSQIYTMPGMTTHLNLLADESGDYAGLSSHFSGDGFSDMHFAVHALPQNRFDEWLSGAMKADPPWDPQVLAHLMAPSTSPRAAFSGVASRLFDQIVQEAAPMAASHREPR